MSEAGGLKLVYAVRVLSEARPDFVVVKVDFRNAFNAVSRAVVIDALETEPRLRPGSGGMMAMYWDLLRWSSLHWRSMHRTYSVTAS